MLPGLPLIAPSCGSVSVVLVVVVDELGSEWVVVVAVVTPV